MQGQEGARKVLVLGASSTIGQAVCHRYLDAGYAVVAHFAHSPEPLEAMARAGAAVTPTRCDLTDLDQAAALGEANTDVDALVCLAALATPTSLDSLDLPLLLETLKVGALSNYVLMGAIGPRMSERGWGRIVIGSSIGVAFGGGIDSFAYALANHTSEFLPRAAREWSATGVLTNVVRIGVTDTALHSAFPGRDINARAALIPMRRPATVDEVADFVFWHGSEANTFVTGQVTAISGGE